MKLEAYTSLGIRAHIDTAIISQLVLLRLYIYIYSYTVNRVVEDEAVIWGNWDAACFCSIRLRSNHLFLI